MIKELLVATSNPAKVAQVRGALLPAGIKVEGAIDIGSEINIVENGQTAVENALIKALAYSKYFRRTVFSMDNALYLEGLAPENQPGLNVRRIPGFNKRPSDDDILRYYQKLISSLGNRVNAHWEFGVCIANEKGLHKETSIISPRIFVPQVSKVVEEGYPLESIQIDPITGRCVAEMTVEEKDQFWQKAIGGPLLRFVESVNF